MIRPPATLILLATAALAFADRRFASHETLVAETHAASIKQREERLRQTIAKGSVWPGGIWGDNLWTLAALRLNEKTDQANARLLKAANAYIETHRASGDLAAHAAFFREWSRSRANSGMWIEVGSTTYQKYSMKNLLYGEGGASSHSRVLEASNYQAPPEAILLRRRAFPAEKPFVIRNRVLGKTAEGAGEGHRIAVDSSLVNYAYRTAHYLLGATLQNPAFNYSGISRQNRTCGLLFDNPAAAKVSQVHLLAEHTGGGRSQHSFWSVQHESTLLVQRIARHGKNPHGSYNTGKLGIRFEGADLQKTEEAGWIFATNGKAFVGVKFLDGTCEWNADKTVANPANHAGDIDTTRILLQAGDVSSHGSFAKFREAVRAHPLTVTPDKVDYRFGENRIEMNRYDALSPQTFALPLINGQRVDLQPEAVYASPFLNGKTGGNTFTVTVGPLKRVLGFSGSGE